MDSFVNQFIRTLHDECASQKDLIKQWRVHRHSDWSVWTRTQAIATVISRI